MITTGSLGTGFVPGLVAVIVFVLIVLWRIRKSDREFAETYSLHAAAIGKRRNSYGWIS